MSYALVEAATIEDSMATERAIVRYLPFMRLRCVSKGSARLCFPDSQQSDRRARHAESGETRRRLSLIQSLQKSVELLAKRLGIACAGLPDQRALSGRFHFRLKDSVQLFAYVLRWFAVTAQQCRDVSSGNACAG